MKYLQFVEQVAERTDVSLGEAEALTRATLRTLAERVSGGQARDLAAQLAVELTPYLTESDEAASIGELKKVYQDMGSSIGYRTKPREITQWYIGLGLLFALGAAGMSLLWTSRLP